MCNKHQTAEVTHTHTELVTQFYKTIWTAEGNGADQYVQGVEDQSGKTIIYLIFPRFTTLPAIETLSFDWHS